MLELYAGSMKKVELDKVLSLLAGCASSHLGKDACLSLKPVSDIEEVNSMLSETLQAYNISLNNGYPGFSDLVDITAIVERADMGGCLQPAELLKVAGVLRCTRNMLAYLDNQDVDSSLKIYSSTLVENRYLEDAIFKAYEEMKNTGEELVKIEL